MSTDFTWFRLNIIMLHKHHIIPRHAGGTDDPSNLVDLTPAEHAEAHRLLYEQYRRWQDYVAWQGLAKLDANFDAAKQAIIEGARKGGLASRATKKTPEHRAAISKKMKEICKNREKTWNGKVYEVTHPDGTTEQVIGLRQWCLDRGFNPNAYANACLRGNSTNGGYRVRKIQT